MLIKKIFLVFILIFISGFHNLVYSVQINNTSYVKNLNISRYELKKKVHWYSYIKKIDNLFVKIDKKWHKEKYELLNKKINDYIDKTKSLDNEKQKTLLLILNYIRAKNNLKLYIWDYLSDKPIKVVSTYNINSGNTSSSPNTSPNTDTSSSPNTNASLNTSSSSNPNLDCNYYISTSWNDSNNWKTIDTSFLTFEKARDTIRDFKINNSIPDKWLSVCIRWWKYFRNKSFDLTNQDSWTTNKPIIYKVYNNEIVKIIWWKEISWDSFKIVNSNSNIWNRLDSSAKWKVFSVNLWSLWISDYGTLKQRWTYWESISWLELFVNNEPMQLARWPDYGYSYTPKAQSYNDDKITIRWTSKVSGIFSLYKTADGVNSYKKDTLVWWLQYYLYRRTWEYPSNSWKMYTAWFISTEYDKYPSSTNPWFSLYRSKLTEAIFSSNNWATWEAITKVPIDKKIVDGFAIIKEPVENSWETKFKYYWDRPNHWTNAEDLWFHWYWKYPWADKHVESENVDLVNKIITLKNKPWYWIKWGMYYYAENLLEEITQPWEWYLNRNTGILYFWPKGDLNKSEILVSILEEPLLRITNWDNIIFDNITFEWWRAELIKIVWNNNKISNSIVRNWWSNWIYIKWNGNNVDYSKVYNIWYSWIRIEWNKEERILLKNTNNLIENNEIYKVGCWWWTYQPWVKIENWVWNIIRNNNIYDMPHTAILYTWNENIIEYNNIHNTNKYSSDAWAVYVWRSWWYRWNKMNNNYIHDLKSNFEWYWVHWIYLDDTVSWNFVEWNIFYNIQKRWIMIWWWRDNISDANVFINTKWYSNDCRWTTAIDNIPWSSWNFLDKIKKFDYQNWIWAEKYPLLKVIPNDWNTIKSDKYDDSIYKVGTAEKDKASKWFYPWWSTFTNNIWYNNLDWFHYSCKSVSAEKSFKDISNNVDIVSYKKDISDILNEINLGFWFEKYSLDKMWIQKRK